MNTYGFTHSQWIRMDKCIHNEYIWIHAFTMNTRMYCIHAFAMSTHGSTHSQWIHVEWIYTHSQWIHLDRRIHNEYKWKRVYTIYLYIYTDSQWIHVDTSIHNEYKKIHKIILNTNLCTYLQWKQIDVFTYIKCIIYNLFIINLKMFCFFNICQGKMISIKEICLTTACYGWEYFCRTWWKVFTK